MRESQIKKLLKFSTIINSSLSIDEVKKKAIQAAMEIFGCEAGSLLLYDPEKDELFFDVALGTNVEKVKTLRLKLGEGIAGYVALHKQPEIVNDVSKDPRFLRKVDEITGFRTINMLCVPVVSKGRTQGVLQILNKKNRGGSIVPFVESDLEVAQALASQIAVAIENARLYEELCKTLYGIIAER